jgi:hypothetical protein
MAISLRFCWRVKGFRTTPTDGNVSGTPDAALAVGNRELLSNKADIREQVKWRQLSLL